MNTSPPIISGTPQDGQDADREHRQLGGTQPITYGFQWQRCDSGGANCVAIAGATGADLHWRRAPIVGRTLRVVVTATNSAGLGGRDLRRDDGRAGGGCGAAGEHVAAHHLGDAAGRGRR